jgi:predicted DNA-binding protein (MmcQ/YjbR family)
MDLGELLDYCLVKPGVTEGFPFDGQTLVFKVMGKMFALCNADDFVSINLKCHPEKALELREQYPDSVLPGFHMNKKHWNTVYVNQDLKDSKIFHWVNHSYELVVLGLPKKDKEYLKSLN